MRPRPPHAQLAHPARSRRAFTLIELLIVLGIIGLLISITLVVGGQVMNSSKKTLTQDTIRVLDASLEAYVKANEVNPDPWVYKSDLDQTGSAAGATARFAAADARDMTTFQMINSVGVYMFQASKVPGAKSALDKLPSKLVTRTDVNGTQPMLTTVMDAWGNPIRYVHPAFQGTIADASTSANPQPTQPRPMDQVLGTLSSPDTYAITSIRRNHSQSVPNPTALQNVSDSDGGTCVGGRPYFYSAGPDGLVGFVPPEPNSAPADCNQDNVYTIKPGLPSK